MCLSLLPRLRNERVRNCRSLVSTLSWHAMLLKSGLLSITSIANQLLICYCRFLETRQACALFDEMPRKNVVSWTSVMAALVKTGEPKTALCMLGKMHRETPLTTPNSFTFSTVINACSVLADIETGRKIHSRVHVLGFHRDLVVGSSLVNMYGKCNEVDLAKRVFDVMGQRNIVSWTSMMVAFAQNGRADESLATFREFNSRARSEPPGHYMLCSLVTACASLGRLVAGRTSHGAAVRLGHSRNRLIQTALVDMYAKCGCYQHAEIAFRTIENPCTVAYTSAIVAAAKFGLGRPSLSLFEEMVEKGVRPNDVTFVGVLHSCSHSGLVREGLGYLDSMREKHGIEPDARHYTCAVDMLGRVGRIDEAFSMAKSTRCNAEEGALLWGTVLSACRLHGRVDVAVEASKRLVDSHRQVSGASVMLSNTYAVTGEWENVRHVRSRMKHKGIRKEPGCSWVEIKDAAYVFYSGDLSCARGDEIGAMLEDLEKRVEARGYVGGATQLVYMEVEQEAEKRIVGLHSERLALAFALLSMPSGITIRVMKNLRMCVDCHEMFKHASDVVERVIVVRDINRFHLFKQGSCSCNDFW